MRNIQPTQEILSSWRRCMEGGTTNTLSSSLINFTGSDLETKQRENELLLSIFINSTCKIDEWIIGPNNFLLISPEGTLLKKIREKY